MKIKCYHFLVTVQVGWLEGQVEGEGCTEEGRGRNWVGGGTRQGRFISLCTVQAGRLEGPGRRVLFLTFQSP